MPRSRRPGTRRPHDDLPPADLNDVTVGDELGIFRRRAEWLRDLYGDDIQTAYALRVAAVAWARRMELAQFIKPALDPGGASPAAGFELVGEKQANARLSRTGNPRPNSSFGFGAEP